ncbi:POEI3 - Pollen Ole e I allergen and extensin family protein precursor [Musa troglodytarum]|uniref:POEI3 - Pollen Ole e I allergen and extensin family protein n=1 Tax=Musa troglodytarum TaxID=320322 RepID=A0A9E7K727_9LILI|nr:POEI3 - Pollen Ole e I allergen and extensin family protein precursor [Musa troglodytarum]
MGTPQHPRSMLLGLCAVLLVLRFSRAATQTETSATVVGATECFDCGRKSVKHEDAVKGLRVAIKCRDGNEKSEIKATGELDSNGNFNVKLPTELLQDNGELKHECLAQLHSASNAPCPDKNGLNPTSKLILMSREKGKHTFIAAAGKLSFSSATCASATFWPPYKDPWHKAFPKYPLPPFKFPPKPYYLRKHHHSIYKPPVPTYSPPTHKPPSPGGSYYNPPAQVHKPPSGGYYKPPAPPPTPEYKPPSGGYYKPPAPVYKPPTPEYKPPSGGYYKPPPAPVYKPTPTPYYKHPYHPIYKKPLPPIPKLPPFYHPYPKIFFPPIYKKPLPHFPAWPPFSHWHKYKKGHPSFPPAKAQHKPWE